MGYRGRGVISWFIGKTLDYIYDHETKRIKVSMIFLPDRVRYSYQKIILYVYVNVYLVEGNSYPFNRLPTFPKVAKAMLRMHRELHQENIFSSKTCQLCRTILEEKPFLQELALNSINLFR